jgi:hypothetical protein
MANLFYKNRLIVVSAQFDEDARSWFPIVDISWETDGQRGSHTMNGPLYHFDNWLDAERHTTELAKAWIEDHPLVGD